MAIAHRGRRVNYDNIAAGSATGVERTFGSATSTSHYGTAWEAGGFSNISVGNRPGVEDTDNANADKLTSDGEDISDAG